jgi:hypothetical protein
MDGLTGVQFTWKINFRRGKRGLNTTVTTTKLDTYFTRSTAFIEAVIVFFLVLLQLSSTQHMAIFPPFTWK